MPPIIRPVHRDAAVPRVQDGQQACLVQHILGAQHVHLHAGGKASCQL